MDEMEDGRRVADAAEFRSGAARSGHAQAGRRSVNAVTIQPVGALTRYDQMCTAIAECIRVDEAKDIRDKALALEAYYRQARNLDAEREAANVRLRAERRVGELLKDLARADAGAARNPNGRAGKEPMSGDRTQVPSPYAAALQDHGMSRQAAHRFQALADIPEAEFDHALRGPDKPSTSAVLKHAAARAKVHHPAPTPTVSDDALWLWGRLRDFENNGYFRADPARLLRGMTSGMRADVQRLAPLVADFLNTMGDVHEPA